MQSVLLLAQIVSDAAMMFLGGGEWLNDAVPNEAIYDTPIAQHKELRVTTNVQAAVASCYSGLIERSMYPRSSLSAEIDFLRVQNQADLKSKDAIYGFSADENTGINRLRLGMDRNVETTRFTDNLQHLVDELQYVSSAEAGRRWAGCLWGSTLWRFDDKLPTWDWTSKDMVSELGVARWRNTWIDYKSCRKDDVWKVDDRISHQSVVDVLESFSWPGSGSDGYRFGGISSLATAASDARCLDILEDRIGDKAHQMTNRSQRLLYHKAGAVETAIRAMDRTFSGDIRDYREFQALDLNYSHLLGLSLTGKAVRGEIDLTGYLSISVDDDQIWTWFESAVISTNEFSMQSWPRPEFLLGECRSDNAISISAIHEIDLTYDLLKEIANTVWFSPDDSGIEINIEPSERQVRYRTIVTRGPDDFIQDEFEINKWHNITNFVLSAEVVVDKRCRLYRTLGVLTNGTVTVAQPSSFAFDRNMPEVDLYASQTRLVAGKYCPDIGRLINDGGLTYDRIDDRKLSIDHRLRLLGNRLTTTNAIIDAWTKERLDHHDAVLGRFNGVLGCGIDDVKTILRISNDSVAALRDDVKRMFKESQPCAITPLITRIDIFGHDNLAALVEDRPVTFWYIDTLNGIKECTSFGKDSRLPMVQYSYSVDDRSRVSGYEDPRSPCAAEGQIKPHFDIQWTFRNLYERKNR